MESTTTKTNNQWNQMTILSTNNTQIFFTWEEIRSLIAKRIVAEQKVDVVDVSVTDWHSSFNEAGGIIFDCKITERSGQ
jgi:hypothetical protein